MSEIVEIDDKGTIQLPTDILTTMPPHTRFIIEVQGETLVLRPFAPGQFWQTATPEERAAAIQQWAALERPTAPPLPDEALHRDQLYD